MCAVTPNQLFASLIGTAEARPLTKRYVNRENHHREKYYYVVS